METKDLYADIFVKANALNAIATVFSDTFASGLDKDIIMSVTAQPDVFQYLLYAMTDYIQQIIKCADELESIQLTTAAAEE